MCCATTYFISLSLCALFLVLLISSAPSWASLSSMSERDKKLRAVERARYRATPLRGARKPLTPAQAAALQMPFEDTSHPRHLAHPDHAASSTMNSYYSSSSAPFGASASGSWLRKVEVDAGWRAQHRDEGSNRSISAPVHSKSTAHTTVRPTDEVRGIKGVSGKVFTTGSGREGGGGAGADPRAVSSSPPRYRPTLGSQLEGGSQSQAWPRPSSSSAQRPPGGTSPSAGHKRERGSERGRGNISSTSVSSSSSLRPRSGYSDLVGGTSRLKGYTQSPLREEREGDDEEEEAGGADDSLRARLLRGEDRGSVSAMQLHVSDLESMRLHMASQAEVTRSG